MVERLRGARAPGCDRADVPRPRPQPAPPFLAAPHEGAPLPRDPRFEAADPHPARSRAARPLPLHAGQGPGATRSNGRRAGGIDRAATRQPPRRPAANRRSRSICSLRVFADYERAKTRAGRIDFDDMLIDDGRTSSRTTPRRPRSSGRGSAGSASTSTRTRTPSRSGCSELWAGDRADVCVVGDEDQTIYTFTGATPRPT